ncbi:UNVERIFIED_CONTAM: hypothetical protein RMT77_009484 [Armadillidium vulgare]
MKTFPHFVFFLSLGICISNCTESRQKRQWFWYNYDEPTLLGFIVNLPFQMFVPGAGVPNARSFSDGTYYEDLSEFYIQPQYEEEVQKLLSIFSYLGISTIACQERLICYLSSNPKKFSPISEMILKETLDEYGPIQVSDKSFIHRYNKALRMGMISSFQKCEEVYSNCPLQSEKMLNFPMLKLWQILSSISGMYLSD